MDTHNTHILLVDDDLELCSLLARYLQKEGLTVSSVNDGERALEQLFSTQQYAAVVLDIMMPGVSGLEVLQRLRAQSDIPVIMLTGRGDDIDRIIGLEMGADDYLGKPCNPRELLARIKAVLRRSQTRIEITKPLQAHGIHLNPGTLSAEVNGEALHLTSAEFSTLQLFLEHIGETLSKELLTERVLQRELSPYDRSMDVHISRVRNKLAEKGLKNVIQSLRGRGYLLLKDA